MSLNTSLELVIDQEDAENCSSDDSGGTNI
jgi:hypothetical protein